MHARLDLNILLSAVVVTSGSNLLIDCSVVSAHASTHAKAHSRHATSPHTRHHVHRTRNTSGVVSYYGHTRQALRTPYSHAVYYTGGATGDYLNQTEGESRWPTAHTIRVYVGPGRSTFPGIVATCFNEWSHASGGKIRWTPVTSPSQADYVIGWTAHQKEVSEGTEAGLTTTDTVVDPDNGREYIERARTNILTRYDGKSLSDREIAETCLHEIGHGLGIEGHSSSPADIMYYAVSSRQNGHLTPRDSNTISKLYAY